MGLSPRLGPLTQIISAAELRCLSSRLGLDIPIVYGFPSGHARGRGANVTLDEADGNPFDS